MSALKKRKVQHERSSFSEEAPRQSKPSKKTMDRIDDTKEPQENLAKKAVKKAATEDVKEKKDKKDRKRKAQEEEEAEASDEAAAPLDGEDETTAPKSFRDLGVIDALAESCEAMGYTKPTPIQSESIPLALQGRDIIGLAETGSGKTAAFALPILQALIETPSSLFGLVLAPTRELAYQISEQFEALGSLIGVKCAVLVGGMDMVSQSIALGKKPHIIVATPGRLLDHLENTRGFSLRTLKYLVMDEADRLLDLDSVPSLTRF